MAGVAGVVGVAGVAGVAGVVGVAGVAGVEGMAQSGSLRLRVVERWGADFAPRQRSLGRGKRLSETQREGWLWMAESGRGPLVIH